MSSSLKNFAKRGRIYYDFPKGTEKLQGISAASTKFLLELILLVMEERDTVNKVRTHMTDMKTDQMCGINSPSKKAEIEAAIDSIGEHKIVYASHINNMIKYANELARTVGNPVPTPMTLPCEFVSRMELIKIKDPPMVPCAPLAMIDPRGIAELRTEEKQFYQICNNIAMPCDHRQKLNGWVPNGNGESYGFSFICTNTNRTRDVDVSSGTGYPTIPSVSKGAPVLNETFENVRKALEQISYGLDEDEMVQGEDGGGMFDETGTCMLMCQKVCQVACQIACQSCFGGTCYNTPVI